MIEEKADFFPLAHGVGARIGEWATRVRSFASLLIDSH